MSFPRTIEEECRELIPTLDKSLKELAFLLEKSKAHIRIDALFQVPLRKSPTVDKNAAIEIATPDGETGIPLAIETLTTIWLGEGQSAKETLRSPGAIGLPALALDRIRETNRLRMHLFDLIEKAKPAERKRIWKAKDHYGISSLQAMRVTPILHDPQLIRFYWDTGSITKRWLVRDGRIDDNRFLPIIYEFSQEMIKSGEARKPENFHLVNPNINYSVDRPTLERLHMQAEIDGEAEMRGFLAKHLNIEIGLALMSDSWVGAAFWEPQAKEGMTLDDLLEQCEVIVAGVDGGGLDDLLGLAVIGRVRESRTWLHWAHAWAHPSVLERRKSEAPRLRDLEATGDLTIVDKIGDDVDQLAAIVAQINQAGLLDKVGLDPAGIGAVLDALADVEIDEEQVVGISQGWKLTGAIKTTERRLAEGTFIHCGQPLMAWSCGNAKGVPSANAFLITKQASGTAKIDPLMATFNAVSLMALNPEARGGLDDYLNHGFFGLVG